MSERFVAVLRRLFRTVGSLYPPDYRNRFLADMEVTFVAECRARAAVSRRACASYAAWTLVSTAWTACGQRLAAWRGSPRSVERGWSGRALFREARYALRSLRMAPGFTAAATVTMALSIGVTTAVFTIVDGVVLRPLPYPESDRLVRLFQRNSPTNRWTLSVVDFQAVAAQQQSFEHVAAFRSGEATITGRGDPARVPAGWVGAEWFMTLGVPTEAGRGFLAGEDDPAAGLVVVISHATAERYFGSADASLGESLTLDGAPHTIVGVLPREVRSMVGWRAEVWPILKLPTPTRRGPFFLRPVARLRAGVSVEAAAEDLARISARIYPLWADGFRDSTARLTPVPLKEVVVGDVQLALYLLLGAVGFVLLIAVANVANLQLARASGRDHEVAVRTALGARRGRIARQLLVESLLLSAIGGVLGVALAHATLTVLLRLGPDLPRLDEVGLDLRVLGFAAVLTLGSGLIFGCAPLAHAFRTDPADALRRGGRGAGRGVGGSRARAALVVAEFALAVPLLAGAVLLMTSLALLQRVDPGFDPTGIATGQVSLPGRVYQDNNARIQFWDRALVVLGDIPGVERVAISSGLPPDAPRAFNNFDLLDRPVPEGTAEPVSPWLAVSPDFFQTMGIPLLAGRALEASDTSAPVVVVSQGWANRFYPGENPVGRRMISGGCTSCAPTTVVGVVGDVAYEGLEAQASDAVYTPYAQWPWASVQLIVRSRGGAVPMEGVRRALGTLDPSLALSEVGTMEERLRASLAKPRYWSLLLGAFATVGVVLAAVGIYGVLSNAVVRQRRDIGIRLALGAARGSVVRMVVTRGMTQAGIGLALGLAGALVLTRWLEGLLFGVSATDPVTFGGVALGLLIVALAACYGPARGATRVDPVRVLSAE